MKRKLTLRSSSNKKQPAAEVGNTHRALFFALTVLIVVGGFVFWQSGLTQDPPMNFAGIGQSLSTDPAQYTFHARNEVLFDDWDPYDYGRWTVYQHSLTSGAAYIWFSIAGVDLAESNRVGVILSLAALILLLVGVARHHRPWAVMVTALIYVGCLTLVTHGRVPYLENGLLFWSAAAFCAYSWWGTRAGGVVLTGALVAAATLTGKLFGALLLPAVMLAVLTSGHEHRWRQVLLAGAGFVGATGLLVVVLYGGDIAAAFAYAGEQSWGLRGFPDGLKSPWAFVEHVVSFGLGNRLFYLNPDLLLLIIVGAGLAVQFRHNEGGLSPVTRLALFWGAVGIVGLAPLNYSPIRYTLLVIPAIIVFAISMFDRTSRGEVRDPEEQGKWSYAILTGAIWLGLFHLVANTFYFNTFPRPIRAMTWLSLAAALILAFPAYRLLLRRKSPTNRRAWIVTLVLVLVAVAAINTMRIRRFHILEDNYTIAEANTDMGAILGAGAVVSGPYGPALTVDTDLQSFIHLFQVAEVDPDLFVENPITHLVMDISNYREAVKNYPELAGITPTARYFIRDVEVGLYRVADLFSNPQANAYEPGAVERAVKLIGREQYDSALALVQPFYADHPESKTAGLTLAEIYVQDGRAQPAYTVLMEMSRRFPTDFNIQLQTGRFLQALAYQTQDRALFNVAQKYFERAVEVNRYRARYAYNLWSEGNRLYGGGSEGN